MDFWWAKRCTKRAKAGKITGFTLFYPTRLTKTGATCYAGVSHHFTFRHE
jgi:hypothetical protein